MTHIPVLLQEVIAGLQPRAGETVLDATVGGGGHSEALCRVMGSGRIICLDADEDAIERSRKRLASCANLPESQGCTCTFFFYRTAYRDLDRALSKLGVVQVDKALFDLGLSSFQLEESGRGFTFMKDEPLIMTFAKTAADTAVTARTIVNEWGEDTIATILLSYGEEKQARHIAEAIVKARMRKPIETTFELSAIVGSVVRRKGRINPATKTFQALRMAVNDEYEGLAMGLRKAWDALASGGRLAVISFQSIEDRTVKDFFRAEARGGRGALIGGRKPVVPTETEIAANPRSRSAKLRIIEKL